MWQVLRRPRWLGYLALALVFAVTTAGLGLWQWNRHEDRVERRAIVEANYGGAPVPIDGVLGTDTPPQEGERWSRVEVTGRYLPEEQHLVRNRPHEGVYGYEVVVPLELADGTAVAVDRGWVRNAPTAEQLPEVPDAPTGQVTVTGWVQPSEPSLGREPVEGQLASISIEDLTRATSLDLRAGYLVLQSEAPAPPTRPTPLAAPDTGLGSHLAYALQWWLTVPVGLVLVLVMARREAQDEGLASTPDAPTGRPGRPPGPRRPRKVRIWDEEDG